MKAAYTVEPEQFEYTGPAASGEFLPELEHWEIASPGEYEFEGGGPAAPPAALSPAALARAVAANRVFARRFGWGCLIGGTVQPIAEILTMLGLAAGATEEDVARAIATWQQAQFGRPGDGQLGPGSWAQVLRIRPPILPPLQFKQMAWDVVFGGRTLGVVEKTAPYELCYLDAAGNCNAAPSAATTRGGARIQLGLRISDMDAVRRAGFVDASGEPHFNWVQMIQTNRPLQQGPPDATGTPTVQVLRRFRRYIDPTAIPRDNHPYYWDEPGDISANIHRVAVDAIFPRASHLCYDLIFWDGPTRALSDSAPPGVGLYWNAEVVLVGIRANNHNVALNSVTWGFDIRPAPGGPTVRLNALLRGPYGGSTTFRNVVGQEIRAGNFPGHCFIGAGFGTGATCT
jgi:hypothetical protein